MSAHAGWHGRVGRGTGRETLDVGWAKREGRERGRAMCDRGFLFRPGAPLVLGLLCGNAAPAGGPLFPAAQYYAGDLPWSVAVGDLNGDEWLDLAVANFWSDNVSVLLNQSERLPGDVDGDGDVDAHDLMRLLLAYASCVGDENYDPAADINGSGCVDLSDLAALLANYGAGT